VFVIVVIARQFENDATVMTFAKRTVTKHLINIPFAARRTIEITIVVNMRNKHAVIITFSGCAGFHESKKTLKVISNGGATVAALITITATTIIRLVSIMNVTLIINVLDLRRNNNIKHDLFDLINGPTVYTSVSLHCCAFIMKATIRSMMLEKAHNAEQIATIKWEVALSLFSAIARL
jgi:hypothetical protein